MNVFTYFSPDGPDLDAQLVPIWEDSWRRQGWTPRVLTIRDARKHRLFDQICPELVAFAQVGGGWYSNLSVINLSFLPRKRKPPLEIFVGGVTWATRKGIEEYVKVFPGPIQGIKPGKTIIGDNEPLMSVKGYSDIESIQHACLQARKKN